MFGLVDLRPGAAAIAVALLLAAPASAAESITSTFDSNRDGWLVIGDATNSVPQWVSSGGNPGGFIRAVDTVGGNTMYWLAPSKFLGDRSTSYGMTLSFDLRQSSLSSQFNVADVRLVSPGLTLSFDHSPNPAVTTFTHYSIPLSESAGWVKSGNVAPSRSEFIGVLSSLSAIHIRAEFVSGPDTDDLDNVVLEMESIPPETTISAAPAALTGDPEASFEFTADEEATFECSLDGAPFETCTSPLQTGALTDGEHTFAVRATDRAGNVDATPATHTWTVDTRPPETSITSGPGERTHDDRATFEFEADEAGASFECSLDGAPFGECQSPHTTGELGDGDHTFAVRATDRAGNVDASPARYEFTVKLCGLIRREIVLGNERIDVCL